MFYQNWKQKRNSFKAKYQQWNTIEGGELTNLQVNFIYIDKPNSKLQKTKAWKCPKNVALLLLLEFYSYSFSELVALIWYYWATNCMLLFFVVQFPNEKPCKRYASFFFFHHLPVLKLGLIIVAFAFLFCALFLKTCFLYFVVISPIILITFWSLNSLREQNTKWCHI